MSAIYPAGAVNVYGETLALSTSLASLGMPGIETKQALIYNPATDFRLHINPAVRAIYFYDASAAAGSRFIDLTVSLSDRTTGGTGTTLDSLTTSDRLYICFSDRTGGFRVDMNDSSVNANASTITVNYWKNDATWADSSDTDGTDNGGASFGQDGSITFADKTDWLAAHLGGSSADNMSITDTDAPGVNGFWVQCKWSAALDADTEIQNIWSLNKDTNRGYFRAGQEYPFSFDRRATGAIEAVLAAGTDTLEVTWIRNVV